MKPTNKDVKSSPPHECLINPGWKEMGHARVLISRKLPDGKIWFASFLVDLYCLGVKDVLGDTRASKREFETLKSMSYFDAPPVGCNLRLAHTIIYRGIEYARKLGFEPHPDFETYRHILISKSEVKFDSSVTCGQGGKPLYIQGHEDDVEQVLATLKKTVGEGNFEFVSQEDVGMNDEEAMEGFFESLLDRVKDKK